MNIQEIEEAEFNVGRQTSQQQALAASRQDWSADPERIATANEIARLRAAGRFVAVVGYPVYCPSTDASMGVGYSVLGDFATEGEARKCLNDFDGDPESYPEVKPPTDPASVERRQQQARRQAAAERSACDDIPF